MRRYEVVFVLAPSLSSEESEQIVEGFKAVAEEKGASIIEIDNWGKKRLAFPVKKHSEGYYTVMTLEEDSVAAVAELERRFKVTDSVLRFLTVRVDEALQRAEKLKTRREAKKSRRRAAAPAPPSAESPEAAPSDKPEETAPEAPVKETAEAAATTASEE